MQRQREGIEIAKAHGNTKVAPLSPLMKPDSKRSAKNEKTVTKPPLKP